jgi:hypothetical protein
MMLALIVALIVLLGPRSLAALPTARPCMNATKLTRVAYVNLDRRTDRRKVMDQHLIRLPIPYERLAAPIMDVEEAKALLPPWMGAHFPRPRLLGTAGCLKSKLMMLQSMAERQRLRPRDELLLLLEDDYVIKKPRALRALLAASLTRAIGSGVMACRPTLVRLDCWADTPSSPPKALPMCNASAVVGKCQCGGTHAMLIPSWGVSALVALYSRRLDEADCVLAALENNYCLNAGIMWRHPRYWRNDIPKGKRRS